MQKVIWESGEGKQYTCMKLMHSLAIYMEMYTSTCINNYSRNILKQCIALSPILYKWTGVAIVKSSSFLHLQWFGVCSYRYMPLKLPMLLNLAFQMKCKYWLLAWRHGQR